MMVVMMMIQIQIQIQMQMSPCTPRHRRRVYTPHRSEAHNNISIAKNEGCSSGSSCDNSLLNTHFENLGLESVVQSVGL